jgi:hypothetical protein
MNTWWEDLEMRENLKTLHNIEVEKMHLPEWLEKECPYCGNVFQPRAIRNIGINFNARNLGDITVEFCCDNCSRSDTLYYKNAAKDMKTFCALLDPECSEALKPEVEPLIEDKMYAAKYNNLVEKTIHKEN